MRKIYDMPAVPPQEVVKDYEEKVKEWYHLTIGDDDFTNIVDSQ